MVSAFIAAVTAATIRVEAKTAGEGDGEAQQVDIPDAPPESAKTTVDNRNIVFRGHEKTPFGEGPIAIKRIDERQYRKIEWFTYVDGSTNGPDGLSTPMVAVDGPYPDTLPKNAAVVLVHRDGIGRPDWYWVLFRNNSLAVFGDCEFGPCDLIWTIEGR